MRWLHLKQNNQADFKFDFDAQIALHSVQLPLLIPLLSLV